MALWCSSISSSRAGAREPCPTGTGGASWACGAALGDSDLEAVDAPPSMFTAVLLAAEGQSTLIELIAGGADRDTARRYYDARAGTSTSAAASSVPPGGLTKPYWLRSRTAWAEPARP